MSELNPIVSCTSPDARMRFNWQINNWCNYKCSYCCANNTDDVDDVVTKNIYKLILAKLSLVEKPFDVCLAGGEPSIHPHIEEILSGLGENKNLHSAFLFTNLSRSMNFLKKIQSITPKVHIHASYHPEYHTEKFIEKCIELKCDVSVSLLEDERYIDNTEYVIQKLIDHGISYHLNILFDTNSWKANYSQNFLDRFKTYLTYTDDIIRLNINYADNKSEEVTTYELVKRNSTNFNGYKCVPESFQINMDGEIRNVCTNVRMPLSLRSKNIIQTVDCPKTDCSYGTLMYPKHRR